VHLSNGWLGSGFMLMVMVMASHSVLVFVSIYLPSLSFNMMGYIMSLLLPLLSLGCREAFTLAALLPGSAAISNILVPSLPFIDRLSDVSHDHVALALNLACDQTNA